MSGGLFLPSVFALLMAAGFVGRWVGRRRWGALVSAAIWVAYAAYEYLVHEGVLCSGDCSIRVDLLVIVPVLLLTVYFAITDLMSQWMERKGL